MDTRFSKKCPSCGKELMGSSNPADHMFMCGQRKFKERRELMAKKQRAVPKMPKKKGC